MVDLEALHQVAMLRVPLKEGTHGDFVREHFTKELPDDRMNHAHLFWGTNDLGAFPLTSIPAPQTLRYSVTVELGRVNLDDETLLGLFPGSVVSLEKIYPSALDLVVDGLVLARGKAVVTDETFGLSVTEVLDRTVAPQPAQPEKPTTLVVILGRAEMNGSKLTTLAKDQVVALDSKTGHPLVAELGGRPFALVDVLIASDTFKFRIRELLCAEPDLGNERTVPSTEQITESIVAELRKAAEETMVYIGNDQPRSDDPELRKKGLDDIKNLLVRVFGSSETVELIHRATKALKGKPFARLNHASPSRLAAILGLEHPQTIAVVLAFLDPEQAATVLDHLDVSVFDDVIGRLVKFRPIGASVLREVERVLERLLVGDTFGDHVPRPAGGVAAALGLLGRATPVTRQIVLELLEESDPELARRLRDE